MGSGKWKRLNQSCYFNQLSEVHGSSQRGRFERVYMAKYIAVALPIGFSELTMTNKRLSTFN